MIRSVCHTLRVAGLALPLAAVCLWACNSGESVSSSSPGGATVRAPGAAPAPAGATSDAIEIQLRPTTGGPPMRVRLRVTPFPSSGEWVPAMAGTLHRALAACIPAGEPAPTFSLELMLEAREARLHAPPASSPEPDLRGCVYKALDQAEIVGFGPEPRSLRIQAEPGEPGT